jgi:hypothetical protein
VPSVGVESWKFLTRTVFQIPNGKYTNAAELRGNGGNVLVGLGGVQLLVLRAVSFKEEETELINIKREEHTYPFALPANHRVIIEDQNGLPQVVEARALLRMGAPYPRISNGSFFQAVTEVHSVTKPTNLVELMLAKGSVLISWLLPERRPPKGRRRKIHPSAAIACPGSPFASHSPQVTSLPTPMLTPGPDVIVNDRCLNAFEETTVPSRVSHVNEQLDKNHLNHLTKSNCLEFGVKPALQSSLDEFHDSWASRIAASMDNFHAASMDNFHDNLDCSQDQSPNDQLERRKIICSL